MKECTCNNATLHKATTVRSEPDVDGLRRCVTFAPAHFCEQMVPGLVGGAQPGTSHGIGSVRVFFALIGPKGAVQYCINSDWHLRASRDHINKLRGHDRRLGSADVDAWDIGYHALAPQYEGHETTGPCDFLDGKPCYYDGSGLRAKNYLEGFLASPDSIWEVLQDEYRARFGKA